MSDFQDNPYASPTAVSGCALAVRDRTWQNATARGLRQLPWTIGVAIVAPIPLLCSVMVEGYWLEVALASTSVVILALLLGYLLSFARLMYRRPWPLLLAFWAAYPIVGLLVLAFLYRRARRELTACGWRVRGFTASPPGEVS